MDQNRRRELRQARRERRQAEQRGTDATSGGAGGRRRLFRATGNQGDSGDALDAVPPDGLPGGASSAGNSRAPTPGAAPMMGDASDPAAMTAMMAAPGSTAAPSTRRRAASRRNDAARLAEKMNQKKRKLASKEQQLTAQEARIQDEYAPNMRELLQGLDSGDATADAAAVLAATTPAMLTNHVTGFDKDDLLATRIADAQANFLKIDQGLSEDHAFATGKLHAAVFAHANDFLLLFRDVDRASRLVEALKSNVQGTKTAISAMSKFTFADVGSAKRATAGAASSSAGAAATASASLFMSPAGLPTGAASVHGRVSLVTERERALTFHANDRGSVETLLASQLAHQQQAQAVQPQLNINASSSSGNTTNRDAQGASNNTNSSGGTALSAGGYRFSSTASRATTCALSVSSLQQWRYVMGAPTNISAPARLRSLATTSTAATGSLASKRGGGATGGSTALEDLDKDAETKSRDIDIFVALVREQMTQLLSERRHAEAAGTLREIASEATRRGCLPLLLDLETDLVRSVLQNLAHIPQSPLLRESAQVPLVQLLLQFGRVKAGVSIFLALQTPWIQSELLTLQSRVANPTRVCWIAADYLVRLMHQFLRRQQTLLLPTDEAQKVSASLETAAAADSGSGGGRVPTAPNVSGANASTSPALDALTEKLQRENKLIPPNSTALLWVRQNMELFATRVLAAQVLSYGTGTDGGDPSRVRRAAIMTTETIRVLQTISSQGSGATAAALTLELMTPSLVLLEAEFSRLTTTRMDNSGRAMVEQLITNSLLMYETSGAVYQPSRCDDAVRKSNARCQWMESCLAPVLPPCAHGWLVQLFLSPATTPLFMKAPNADNTSATTASNVHQGAAAGAARSPTTTTTTAAKAPIPMPFFSQERYRFVRYANGCSVVHQLLLQSVIGFICALGGSDDVLGNLDGDEGGRTDSSTASPASATSRTMRSNNNNNSSAATADSNNNNGAGASAAKNTGAPASRRVQGGKARGGAKDAATASSSSPLSAEASPLGSVSSAAECASLLLSNALILESADVTLYRIFISFLWTSLRERQSLAAYLSSDAFAAAQQKLFPRARASGGGAPTPWPLLCDPTQSPAFVLDGLLGLLTDVLSVGTWLSYLCRGGAVAHLLGSPQLGFRTQHVASLHTAMPGIVQGWLACVLSLGHSTDAAVDLLPVPCSATVEEAAELAGPRRPAGLQTGSSNGSSSRRAGAAQVNDDSKGTAKAAGAANTSTTGSGGGGASAAANNNNSNSSPIPGSPAVGSTLLKRSFGPSALGVDGVASGGAVNAAIQSSPGTRGAGGGAGGSGAGLRAGGRARVLVMRRDLSGTTDTNTTNTTASNQAVPQRSLPGIRGVHKRSLRLLPESVVRQSKLRSLLMSLLERPYCTPKGYTVHHALPSLLSLTQRRQEVLQQQSHVAGSTTTTAATASSQKTPVIVSGATMAAWGVRATIASYPEFPIGGDFDRKDELFLLHWCAQINLHLLTVFQERLLPSSHMVNGRALATQKGQDHSSVLARQLTELKGAAPLQRAPTAKPPLQGGVSPQEDSALAGLCGGGGSYPAAVAALQFLVLRVLRDVLCQVETWSIVYDCTSPTQWRQDESVLRQQLFFFSLFARFWAPLFAGGTSAASQRAPAPSKGPATRTGNPGDGGSQSSLPDDQQTPSQWSTDGIPALAVLEWLTSGHAVLDMHLNRLRRQRAQAMHARRLAAAGAATATTPPIAVELTEEQISVERQRHPRLQSAVDTYFDPQRVSSGAGAASAGGGGGGGGQGWKREDTLRPTGPTEAPLTMQEATHLLGGKAGPYIPDTLLRVLQYFFEEMLGETRAVPAMTSDAMRTRVDKAMLSVNLADFVGSSLGDDDDDEDSEEESASSAASSSLGGSRSSSSSAAAIPITLTNLRDLLEFYVRPLL